MSLILIGYSIQRTVHVGGYLRQEQIDRKIEYKVIIKWVAFSSSLLPHSHPSKQFFKADTFYFPLLFTKHQKKFNYPLVSNSHTEK